MITIYWRNYTYPIGRGIAKRKDGVVTLNCYKYMAVKI